MSEFKNECNLDVKNEFMSEFKNECNSDVKNECNSDVKNVFKKPIYERKGTKNLNFKKKLRAYKNNDHSIDIKKS